MTHEPGHCAGCDREGPLGEPCQERACRKRGYHFIPMPYWERANAVESGIDPLIGQRFGEFVVVDIVGAGGFGKVYLALQVPLLELKGALKLLDFPTDNPETIQALLERFRGEAEALARLFHPNIVRLLTYNMADQRPYLVMEYVEGGRTLGEEIRVRAQAGRSFGLEEVSAIFNQILHGLEAAHEQRIVHRDIKPENVMLQPVVGNPHHVRILDFGMAKFVANRADTHLPMGSPAYMAPEQVSLKNLGPWTDLYAVGVMAFELLTGRRPFPGATDNEMLLKKIDADYDPLCQIEGLGYPARTREFFSRALARDPEARIGHAAQFAEALRIAIEALVEVPELWPSNGIELTGLVDSGIRGQLDATRSPPMPTTLAAPPPLLLAKAGKVGAQVGGGVATPPAAPSPSPPPEATRHGRRWPVVGAVAGAACLLVLAILAYSFARDDDAPVVAPGADRQAPAVVADDTPPELVAGAAAPPADGEADEQDDDAIVEVAAATEAATEAAPAEVAPVGIVAATAGMFHTCALLEGGAVRCWGANHDGELGLGHGDAVGSGAPANAAPVVEAGGKAVALAAAGEAAASVTCALLEGGAVRCWGANGTGQLGVGHTRNVGRAEHPRSGGLVDLGGRVTQLAIGATRAGGHACALLASGDVRCWGHNAHGQLGLAHTRNVGDVQAPITAGAVALGGAADAVTAGDAHTCALLVGGRVRCWGNNRYGQLGYGHTDTIGDDDIPASAGYVALGEPARQVSAGRAHTCALLEGGRVRCWGWNRDGQLGYGHTRDIGAADTPEEAGDVDVGAPVAQLSAGGLHTCALVEGGSVRCWGNNTFGQLGYGHTRPIGDAAPPWSMGDVHLGQPARSVHAGAYHTCAVLEDATLRCWGWNEHGQLGYGHTNNVGDVSTPASAGEVPVF